MSASVGRTAVTREAPVLVTMVQTARFLRVTSPAAKTPAAGQVIDQTPQTPEPVRAGTRARAGSREEPRHAGDDRRRDLRNGKFSIGWSLAVIGALIGASLVLSLVVAPHGHGRSGPHPAAKRTHGHDAA
jgi:hypothetical protein